MKWLSKKISELSIPCKYIQNKHGIEKAISATVIVDSEALCVWQKRNSVLTIPLKNIVDYNFVEPEIPFVMNLDLAGILTNYLTRQSKGLNLHIIFLSANGIESYANFSDFSRYKANAFIKKLDDITNNSIPLKEKSKSNFLVEADQTIKNIQDEFSQLQKNSADRFIAIKHLNAIKEMLEQLNGRILLEEIDGYNFVSEIKKSLYRFIQQNTWQTQRGLHIIDLHLQSLKQLFSTDNKDKEITQNVINALNDVTIINMVAK